MQNYLVISALVENSSKIIRQFSKISKTTGCNVTESRFRVIGQELSLLLFLTGSWDVIAKAEGMFKGLEQEHQINILTKRTTVDALKGNTMSYAVDIVGLDRSGLIFDITDFMLKSELLIHEMSSNTYQASLTGANMFSLNMIVHISTDLSIATIRADFMEFCDDLNLDAIMEPVK